MPRDHSTLRRLLVALALVATSALAVLPAATPAEARGGKVKVVLKVQGCEGCEITLISPSGRVVRSVSSGKATFTIPRRDARGTYFKIVDVGAVGTDGEDWIALRYAGRKPGSTTTAALAASASGGYPCWAGTDRKRVKLRVVVDRYADTNFFTGETGYNIRPYLRRAVRTVGDRKEAHNGALGGQESPFCLGVPS